MTPTETTTILRQFNERCRDCQFDDPHRVMEAIDAAIEMIERVDGALETLLVRCNNVDTLEYIDLSTDFVRDTVRIARGEQE